MRIAVAQMPGAQLAQWRQTLALAERLIAQAAALGAELAVLPECAWPAYHLGGREAYRAARAAGLPPPAEFVARLERLAADLHLSICAGYVAEEGDALFNAACLIEADGRLVGTHRKCFLWAFDRRWFEAGRHIAVCDVGPARIGVMVCADARLPEIAATLAARGAELIVQPTAWVNAGTPAAPWNPQAEFLIAARAAEFGVPIASASKWGFEGDTEFIGSSLICDAGGQVLNQCGPQETGVVAADITPRRAAAPPLTDAERAALLADSPAVPPARDAPTLHVLALPPCADAAQLEQRVRVLAAQRAGQCTLALGAPSFGPSATPTSVRTQNCLALTGPGDDLIQLGQASVAAVRDAAARTFAALRCLNDIAILAPADNAEARWAARAAAAATGPVYVRMPVRDERRNDDPVDIRAAGRIVARPARHQ